MRGEEGLGKGTPVAGSDLQFLEMYYNCKPIM